MPILNLILNLYLIYGGITAYNTTIIIYTTSRLYFSYYNVFLL